MNHSFRGIELLLILLFSYFLVFCFWFLVGGFIPRSMCKPSFISEKMKRKIFTKCKNKFEKKSLQTRTTNARAVPIGFTA